MYTVVTGAAGFIGSNLVKALNARSERDILAVDNLSEAEKFRNLVDCDVADYLDQDEFLSKLNEGHFDQDIDVVFHQGACSNTLETDGRFMLQNNYRYSVQLLNYCQELDIPFIYASSAAVYGMGPDFREEREAEKPLNIYGYSKFLFDQYVRRLWDERTAQIVGLRYFNVYGLREHHKQRMASVIWHFFHQYQTSGQVKLFSASGGYADGEQRRDFVTVNDVVAVNLYFLDHAERSGIFNVGTGRAESFNAVATAVINACRRARGDEALSLAELQRNGSIRYIAFPHDLQDKYQSFTEADLGKLRAAGFTAPLQSVEEGVSAYVKALLSGAV